ncbi:MAG: hypothetical protein IJE43_17875 [Alphaproteobacteria bacterium]|nr:hypothetical protein [Alphaproteobacteria bacterium]MBQ3513926.1 hypothetical protein [Lachnospiraceae bacterium]
MENYTEGIAFILEGTTEKVFYKAYLEHLVSLDACASLVRDSSSEEGEIIFCWTSGDKKVLIKFYVVGTITQIVHSGKWFLNKCCKKYKVPWTVYLCYDTDSSNANISKFYEGDWKILRQELEKAKTKSVIDLAASADIEDIMLYDIEGVLKFLAISMPEKLVGRKGKAKMKALYRSAGSTYHEGDRAKEMIERLNFAKITQDAPIDLSVLKEHLLK